MAFFVEVSKTGKSKGDREPERIDLRLLAIGKRTGLSFAEMNEFRVSDLLAYSRAYTGDEGSHPRKATQADIDALLA